MHNRMLSPFSKMFLTAGYSVRILEARIETWWEWWTLNVEPRGESRTCKVGTYHPSHAIRDTSWLVGKRSAFNHGMIGRAHMERSWSRAPWLPYEERVSLRFRHQQERLHGLYTASWKSHFSLPGKEIRIMHGIDIKVFDSSHRTSVSPSCLQWLRLLWLAI